MCCISTLLIIETSNAMICEACAFTDGGRGISEGVRNCGEYQKDRVGN